MRRLFPLILSLLILALLPALLFVPVFLGNSIVSGDFSGSDLLDLHLPFRYVLYTALHRGQIPLWNTQSLLGFPFLAEGQSGIFYLPNILVSLLDPALSLNISIILSIVTAGLGMFFFMRLQKFSYIASVFAGLSFCLSAFFIARLKHINLIAVASLFPLLMTLSILFFRTRKVRYIIITGLIIALMLFAGHPQMTFYSLFVFLLYSLFQAINQYRRKGDSTVIPAVILYILLSFGIGIGLSAVQTIPTAELTQHTERVGFTEYTLTAYPFHPKNLILLLSPFYFGTPADGTYQQNVRETGVYWENVSYFGLIPLGLSLFALILLFRKKFRSSTMVFFAVLSLLSLTLMLGRFTPLFLLLTENVPFFGLFRFPTRFNLFFIFALVFLAASSLEYILTKVPKKFIMLVGVSVIALVVIDLAIFTHSYISFVKNFDLLKTPTLVSTLSRDTQRYRIWNLTQYDQSPYQTLGWKKTLEPILKIREALPPNNHILYGLSSFSDRAWFEGGLTIRRRSLIERFLIQENQDQVVIGKLLGLFNVKYIIAFQEQIGIEIEKVKELNLGKSFASGLKLFKNNQVLPRAFIVPEATVVKDEDSLFKTLTTDTSFLPSRTVLLEENPKKIPPSFDGSLVEYNKNNTVTITSYQDTTVQMKAKLKDHGFLVFSDSFYPGWVAVVNGEKQHIFRADYAIRALELFPGNYTISFTYQPASYLLGLAISLLTLSLLILGVVGFVGRKMYYKLFRRR